MTIQPETLRQAMRKWTSGVTVVTAQADGQRHGMTVSSFISVSLDPPLVLVSIANTALTGELIRRSGFFGVTILGESQQELSEIFAGRIQNPGDRFSGVECVNLISDIPYPAGGMVMMECRVVGTFPGGASLSGTFPDGTFPPGTNTLFLGEVNALEEGRSQNPLVYFNKDYQELCP